MRVFGRENGAHREIMLLKKSESVAAPGMKACVCSAVTHFHE